MNEDYLWDRSGEGDADIAHLEEVLGELRWRRGPLDSARVRRGWRWGVAAAVLLVAAGTTWYVERARERGAVTSWEFSMAGEKGSAVRGGEVIETSAGAGGTMRSEEVGEVNIEPDSMLRLVSAREGLQRLALEHGTIHAFIWARPATFVVDTPSARTVDLGCQYTLKVAKDGTGFLSVEMGWVAFEWRGVESFIPAGAVCFTRRGHGPDTPYFKDAAEAFSTQVAEFDRSGNAAALNEALARARPRDGLTLWHLLQRTQGAERAAVFERFATLVSLPANVTREAILRGDQSATDAAWNALDLGDMRWWRGWKRRW